MGITAAIVGLGAATVGASVISSRQASASAKKAAAEGNARQLKLEKELADRQSGVESEAQKLSQRDAARKRQRSAAAGASGRPDTILTGALGEVDENQGTSGRSTILGG